MVHFHLSLWWLSKMKLQISYEGEKLHTVLLLHRKSLQTDKQPGLIQIFARQQCQHAPPESKWRGREGGGGVLDRNKEMLYLGCWTGCQWQRFHSTPRRGRLVGHWCHCPRSHTETDREKERQGVCVLIYNGLNANWESYEILFNLHSDSSLFIADSDTARASTHA